MANILKLMLVKRMIFTRNILELFTNPVFYIEGLLISFIVL